MKFLIILAVCLAVASAERLYHRDRVVPVVDGRITNGNDAVPGQFPYQVGLSLRVGVSSAWCGGSLIGNTWVLTAAHCTDGVSSVTVYLGATVRTNPAVTYTVNQNEIIIHANWNKNNLLNDISLIKIPSVAYTELIQPVRLPANTYSTYAGDYAIASGWGRTSDASNAVSMDLKWAQLQVITNSVCALTYGSSIVAPSNICVATPNGVSTCNGDSGGPLVLDSTKVQIGLTSYGAAAGCEKGHPVAFTRITSYLDWIKANTGISY